MHFKYYREYKCSIVWNVIVNSEIDFAISGPHFKIRALKMFIKKIIPEIWLEIE